MRHSVRIGVLFALGFWLTLSAAQAEKRVALVIGNEAYTGVAKLTNPVRDAKAVAAVLRAAGFTDVAEGYNLTKHQLDDMLKRFGDAAEGADWALVYFAGHGISIGGESYVLPVDAALAKPEHVDDEAISLSRIRAKASGAKTLRMVMLDSCRNNPFVARMKSEGGKRAVKRGLSRPTAEAESGELIAYATRENDEADDGNSDHSPFTAAFLENVAEPGLEVNFLFRRIRASVVRTTKNTQEPAIYASLSDTQLYFVAPAVEAHSDQGQGGSFSEAERAWERIKESKSLSVLGAFRGQYGKANPMLDALAADREKQLKTAMPYAYDLSSVKGFVMGKSTVAELAVRGKKKSGFDSYEIDKMNFWYDKEKQVFESVYITYTEPLPEEWTRLGLSFQLSYNEWLELLKKMDYEVHVTQEPTTEMWRNSPSFAAKLEARSTSRMPLKIKLNFSYSEKVGANAAGTLYSIDVSSIAKE